MARELNTRQLKFAAAVAAGRTRIEAYEEAGYAVNGKRETAVRNAKRKAKHVEVRAAIEEMQLQLMPAPDDMRAVYAHGLATIIQLSNSCEDSRTRLAAAQWLCAEAKEQAEKRQTLEAARGTNPREEIIAELRALYRKALPEREPLVEAVSTLPGDE
jgi:hypothetical protein